MKAVISYAEILDFVEKSYRIRPTVTTINRNSIELGYKPAPFIPAIELQLSIRSVSNDMLSLSYDCGAAATVLLNSAINAIKQHLPSGIVIDVAERRVDINLRSFDKLVSVLNYVSISNIFFENDAVNVDLSLV